MGKKIIRVGVFRGLLTPKGTLRIQMRTEKGSVLGPGISYVGDFELSGGKVEAELSEALTFPVLLAESAREVKEELGINVGNPDKPSLFRMVFKSPDGWEDWAFVIPTPHQYWDADDEMTRKTVDVNPKQLMVLGDLNLIVSGTGKRMWRMAQSSLMESCDVRFQYEARRMLDLYPSGSGEVELLESPEEALANFRCELGL